MEAPISEYIRRATAPVFLLVLVVSLPLTLDAAGSNDKPNIVLVLMDNFGYGTDSVMHFHARRGYAGRGGSEGPT